MSFLLFSSFARRARSSVYSHWPQIVPARPHQCVRVPRKRAWLVEFPSVDDRAVAPTAATFATRVVVVPQYGSLAPPAASDPFSALDSHADSLIQRAEGCRRALAQARPRAPSLSSLLCLWAASQKPVFSLFRCPALARSLLFSSFRAARREKPSRRPPLRLEASANAFLEAKYNLRGFSIRPPNLPQIAVDELARGRFCPKRGRSALWARQIVARKSLFDPRYSPPLARLHLPVRKDRSKGSRLSQLRGVASPLEQGQGDSDTLVRRAPTRGYSPREIA